jgi:rubrerythrin
MNAANPAVTAEPGEAIRAKREPSREVAWQAQHSGHRMPGGSPCPGGPSSISGQFVLDVVSRPVALAVWAPARATRERGVSMPDESVIGVSAAASRTPRGARAADAWKRPDLKARMLAFMVRCRSRLPGWHEEALGVLASAEADGVRILEAALPAIGDSRLRRIFLSHIEDERRHTQGFTDLYREFFPNRELPAPLRPAISTNVLDFFAFLEITEMRGEQMIRNYHGLYTQHPKVQAFMSTVLRDERYHANYLRAQLQSWTDQGLAKQVASARRAAAQIDARGFRSQLLQFILGSPRLLLHGVISLVRGAR